ncbi:hypothetical protein G6F65_020540 [Rhizopus arrhizus]|nr:hypothetical protein G6F65_020540 [Rhizopus arrhizus]
MSLRLAPWLTALMAARLITCSTAGCAGPAARGSVPGSGRPAAARHCRVRAAAGSERGRPTGGDRGRPGNRRPAPGRSGCGWWPPRCARPPYAGGRRPGAGSRRSAARAAVWPAPAAAVRPLHPGIACRRWPLRSARAGR